MEQNKNWQEDGTISFIHSSNSNNKSLLDFFQLFKSKYANSNDWRKKKSKKKEFYSCKCRSH